jgi:hypothetical protein
MPTKRQRRKRRRRHAPGEASVQSPRGRGRVPRSTRSADPTGRPLPPWGDFPLSEIVVFVGILLLIAGFFVAPPQGFVMIAVGLVLGSLAGLELSIREHFAGYRSHTLLLAAAIGVPIFGVLFVVTDTPPLICVAAGAVAFGGSAWLFAQAFQRRSGGALFRLRG